MATVGQIEKRTQARIVALFQKQLGYDYLGNLIDAENRNIDRTVLRSWLVKRSIDETLINRALHELTKLATDTSKSLYDRNRDVYELLRYGVKVQPGAGEQHETVWLVDWAHPLANNFAIAEEVTVKGADAKASAKRPDVVIYINGIALGVLELKRSTVSVAEGIRQNLDNQKKEFIQPFFSTMQWVMAGNDTEGLRYATVETPEKYYLRWVEETGPYMAERSGPANLNSAISGNSGHEAGPRMVWREGVFNGEEISATHPSYAHAGIQGPGGRGCIA